MTCRRSEQLARHSTSTKRHTPRFLRGNGFGFGLHCRCCCLSGLFCERFGLGSRSRRSRNGFSLLFQKQFMLLLKLQRGSHFTNSQIQKQMRELQPAVSAAPQAQHAQPATAASPDRICVLPLPDKSSSSTQGNNSAQLKVVVYDTMIRTGGTGHMCGVVFVGGGARGLTYCCWARSAEALASRSRSLEKVTPRTHTARQ